MTVYRGTSTDRRCDVPRHWFRSHSSSVSKYVRRTHGAACRKHAGSTEHTYGAEGRQAMNEAVSVAAEPADAGQNGYDTRATHGEWRIRCQDILNRDRSIGVFVRSGRVLLVGPPGETAVLSSEELGELRTALDRAAGEAER